MSKTDYEMAESMSKTILKTLEKRGSINPNIYRNLLKALVYISIDNEKIGPTTNTLYMYLSNEYANMPISRAEGFDRGVIFGVYQMYNMFKKVKNSTYGK